MIDVEMIFECRLTINGTTFSLGRAEIAALRDRLNEILAQSGEVVRGTKYPSWSAEEDALIRACMQNRTPVRDVADELGRTMGACYARIKRIRDLDRRQVTR